MIDIRDSVRMSADTEFFFINSAYLDAYIRLLEGIRQHHNLSLLIGESGVGKTLLLRKLINEAPANIKFVFCYSTNFNLDDLLTVISDQLGIAIPDGEFTSRSEALNGYFSDCVAQGVSITLIIDDAHHLSKDTLDGFFNLSCFELTGKGTVQIILSGTQELEDILIDVDIFHNNLTDVVRIYLEPLTAADVVDFILRKTQFTGDKIIIDSLTSSPVIKGIDKYTGGVPRLVNMLCEHALRVSKVRGKAAISVDIINEAASELMLKERNTDLLPELDFDALDMTHSDNVVQVAKMEQLLGHENLMNDETQSSVARPLPVDEVTKYSPAIIQWDDQSSEKEKPSKLLNPARLQLLFLVFLVLLAGMLGGMGGIYLYQHIAAQDADQPKAPISAASGPTASPSVSTPGTQSSPQLGSLAQTASVGIQEVPSIAPKVETLGKPLESLSAPPILIETTRSEEKGTLPPTVLSPIIIKPLDASIVSSYMKNGDLLLERGDVASARLFYQEAAHSGLVDAMVAVGKTYDPVVLAQLGIKGFYPNPIKAAEWYLKARERAADPQSIEHLEVLRSWLSNSPDLGEIEASTLRQLLQ
ncbi:MAG: AAA family ATPase [Phycisphaerales bacterium]|nr:AAA family ATPase [Phycisphaerales bacterium]